MRRDIYSVSIDNQEHYKTIRRVYENHNVILDPHGSVGWKALEKYTDGKHTQPAVVYETADPGKFPKDIEKATGVTPDIPEGIRKQQCLEERLYTVGEEPSMDKSGAKRMSAAQYKEIKQIIGSILKE
jgi:threonine synthase